MSYGRMRMQNMAMNKLINS
jgi:hypothetical protein